jgi:hypothetical protein
MLSETISGPVPSGQARQVQNVKRKEEQEWPQKQFSALCSRRWNESGASPQGMMIPPNASSSQPRIGFLSA